jgi:Lanthionine-containing peptide SapB precursor RamS
MALLDLQGMEWKEEAGHGGDSELSLLACTGHSSLSVICD